MTKRNRSARRIRSRRTAEASATLSRRIVELANQGKSPAQIRRATGTSLRWVYMVMAKKKLPRNVPIRPDSKLEGQVVKALVKMRRDTKAVAKVFCQAPCNIEKVLRRVQKQAA